MLWESAPHRSPRASPLVDSWPRPTQVRHPPILPPPSPWLHPRGAKARTSRRCYRVGRKKRLHRRLGPVVPRSGRAQNPSPNLTEDQKPGRPPERGEAVTRHRGSDDAEGSFPRHPHGCRHARAGNASAMREVPVRGVCPPNVPNCGRRWWVFSPPDWPRAGPAREIISKRR